MTLRMEKNYVKIMIYFYFHCKNTSVASTFSILNSTNRVYNQQASAETVDACTLSQYFFDFAEKFQQPGVIREQRK